MLKRIREIVIKELRQTFREPKMRFFLFGPPMIQLIVFGYAVNLDVEDTKMAWLDQDRTVASRELRARFEGSSYFDITETPANAAAAQNLLDRSAVSMVVSVLPGFSRDLERGDTAQVQVLVDGTNSNTASVVSSYAAQVINGLSAYWLDQRQGVFLMSATASSGIDRPRELPLPSVNAQTRVWFNEDLRSRNYFVPGILVNIITIVTLMLTALAIVREKEIGTMEQLMVTPVRPLELMLGKTIPFAMVGLVQIILVISVSLLVFRVPLRGSLPLLMFTGFLFVINTLGFGLLISTTSDTQQQAMMGSFMFFMPALMLSGFAFPIASMPEAVQYFTYLNPLRYFTEIVRGIFLKGVGLEILWPQTLALVVSGISVVTLSALRFHKRLD
jgi:drug efflux transport system permease protein